MAHLTTDQLDVLTNIERVGACLSLVCTILILVTFLTVKEFRTLSNTLIFLASPANLFSNTACLIGNLGLLSGQDGALCQFQAFLLEAFMQTDSFWSLAMAVNVYLVFFRQFEATTLWKLCWIYTVLCYGVPLVPGVAFLFISDPIKGKIYGDATLWCWIRDEWAPLRIYTDYALVWISVFITVIIYVSVGVKIFQTRRQLRQAIDSGSSSPFLARSNTFSGFRTTEIEITRQNWDEESTDSPITSPIHCFSRPQTATSRDQYYVSISSASPLTPPHSQYHYPPLYLKPISNSTDKIKWAYTKTALLFLLSILITWVPASANRVYGLLNPATPNFALNVATAIVLPLQGFWNAVIYFTTSLRICKKFWARWRRRKDENEAEERRMGRRLVAFEVRGDESAVALAVRQ